MSVLPVRVRATRETAERPRLAASLSLHAHAHAAALALGTVVLFGSACGTSEAATSEADACVEAPLDCQPIVSPPTFDAVYTNVLRSSCGAGAGACHGAAVSGGLDMRTADAAFAGLAARSQPESVGCSLLVKRIESDQSAYRMPPGPTPLSEPQRCAIRQWVANGARR